MNGAVGLLQKFEASRARPHTLKSTAWRALREALGDSEAERLSSEPLGFAVSLLSDAIDAHGGSGQPAYHNEAHFKEAVLAMGALCSAEFEGHPDRSRLVALGVIAMAGHDFLHDGTRNEPGKSLEENSFRACLPLLRQAGLGQADVAAIESVILGTEDRLLGANRAAYQARQTGPLGREVDQLRMLANEADLSASLLPGSGQKMGALLASEWNAAGIEMGKTVASWAGRLGFLGFACTGSAAARAMGLEEARDVQVRAFSRLASRLGAPSAPEAAKRLDAIAADAGPKAALSLYAGALADESPGWGAAAFGLRPVIGNASPGDPAAQDRAIEALRRRTAEAQEPSAAMVDISPKLQAFRMARGMPCAVAAAVPAHGRKLSE